MKVSAPAPSAARDDAAWSGPGAPRQRAGPFTWSGFLWGMIYPQRGQRTLPTIPGAVLIGLAMGIGTAAYNSANNILFITLSLLLSCLILSGVLAWLNLRRVRWRLHVAPPLRAGHDTVVTLALQNGKSFLPTYGLWFEFAARRVLADAGAKAESTVTARGAEVRAAIARADASVQQHRVALGPRLDPGGEAKVEWVFKPEVRGRLRIELVSVASLFPFGFLRKDIGAELAVDAVVWPAPVAYQRHAAAAARQVASGERIPRAGPGGDLLALRRYAAGDSHRLIHWKASARTGTLLVRQFAAERAEGYSLWVRTDAGVWAQAEQFELLIGFAASMAEDLYRAGSLLSAAINAEPPLAIRRIHDLELWLNQLAVVQPVADGISTVDLPVAKQSVVTFMPEGTRGVAAFVDGERVAST